MSSTVLDLVTRLRPLRSPQVRFLLTVLADLADDTGDCGPVPVKVLAERTQSTVDTVAALLAHLEDDVRLISRSEQATGTPNRVRVQVDRLRHPDAGRLVDGPVFTVLGGPLDGYRVAPPAGDLSQVRRIHSHRLPAYGNKAFCYRPTPPRAERWAPDVVVPPWEPLWLRHVPQDEPGREEGEGEGEREGIGHVYRLGACTWLHSGLDLAALDTWARSPLTVTHLRAVDVVSVEELHRAIADWAEQTQGEGPAGFAAHLARGAAHLFDRRPASTTGIVPDTIAADALYAHRRWIDAQTGQLVTG